MKQRISYLMVLGILLSAGCTGPAAQANPTPTFEQPASSTPVVVNPTEPLAASTNTLMPSSIPITPAPTANLILPTQQQTQSGENGLTNSDVYLDKVEVIMQGSAPMRPTLQLQGSLPTPCNKLQIIVGKPDASNLIKVQVTSQVDPNQMCAQVLVPFTKSVPIENLSSGKYTVWVNGKQAGNIDMP